MRSLNNLELSYIFQWSDRQKTNLNLVLGVLVDEPWILKAQNSNTKAGDAYTPGPVAADTKRTLHFLFMISTRPKQKEFRLIALKCRGNLLR